VNDVLQDLRIGALLAGLAMAPLALASAADTTAEQGAAFDRFMSESRPVCLHEPAERCIAIAWRFADADGDEGLSLAELAAIRAAFAQWTDRHREDLTRPERSGIALGFLIVDSLGLERLHALYDADQDGLLSRSELLAEVRLDERPLGAVLLDPAATDHRAVARRLGIPLSMVENALP
jgi:hypothetical protein